MARIVVAVLIILEPSFFFCFVVYRDDEGNRVDHLQQKRHLENLLPNVPLKENTANTNILPL